MKTGRTLTELAAELERQREAKRDFVADTRRVRMVEAGGKLALDLIGQGFFDVNPHCHRQISTRVKIPAPYYDRCLSEAPGLLAAQVNHWLDAAPEKRMIRTLDGAARAWVSDSYRPLDNADLAEAALPVLIKAGVQLQSCEVTPLRLYIKGTLPGRTIENRVKGFYDGGREDKVETYTPGVVIGNSEVSAGSLFVAPGIHTVECTNLAVFKNDGLRKYHVGRRIGGDDDEAREYITDRTRQLEDAAFFSKVGDMVKACIEGDLFTKLTERMRAAGNDRLEGDPDDVVEVAGRTLGLTEVEKGGILRMLAEGGDLSRLGLSQAVTRYSGQTEDYDRASDLERIGGQIIELPKTQWTAIATAKAA